MKRLLTVSAVTLIMLFTAVMSTACANLLEDYIESISPHISLPYERPPVEQKVISSMEEFEEFLLDLIISHQTETNIQYNNVENEDVQAEIDRISREILENHPIAVYAVTEINLTATRIVRYFEIDIEIEFMRTAEQLEAIINAPTARFMMTSLLEIMSRYDEEAVFRTGLQLTGEDIIEQIVEIYYQNPREIVMMPFVTVEMFPEQGEDRIYVIRFGYTQSPEMLRLFGESLDIYVRQNAERAVGDNQGEILLSLVENLMASTEFDEGTAGTISMHAPQNIAATAFGAFVRGSAVGEGFAMAFKALCDELRIECRVVLGFLDEKFHAWNIVALEGYYYHIDVSMSVVLGLEAAFLKNDGDFEEFYIWDRENTQICNGPLTLYDIMKVDNDTYPENGSGDETENITGGED